MNAHSKPPARPVAVIEDAALAKLAEQINAAHQAFETAVRSSLEHAVTTGQLLIEAKSKVRHGDWTSWVKANCRFSARTARLYMQIAAHPPKMATVADLTLRGCVTDNVREKDGSSPPPSARAAGRAAGLSEEAVTALDAALTNATMEETKAVFRLHLHKVKSVVKIIDEEKSIEPFRNSDTYPEFSSMFNATTAEAADRQPDEGQSLVPLQ